MAKNLKERLASAKANPGRIRTADLAALIEDLEKEKERQLAIYRSANEDAANFLLDDADRDEASRNATRALASGEGIERELEGLRTLLVEKRDSDQAKASAAARETILAERDELAARIPAMYEKATGILIEMAEAILANERRMAEAGINEPGAEAIARGGSLVIGMTPLSRLTKIRLPKLREHGNLWPVAQGPAATAGFNMDNIVRERKAEQESRDAAGRAMFGHYSLSQSTGSMIHFSARLGTSFETRVCGLGSGPRHIWTGEIEHSEAERLRGMNVEVERLEAPVEVEQ